MAMVIPAGGFRRFFVRHYGLVLRMIPHETKWLTAEDKNVCGMMDNDRLTLVHRPERGHRP